jgi:hypothetical protein
MTCCHTFSYVQQILTFRWLRTVLPYDMPRQPVRLLHGPPRRHGVWTQPELPTTPLQRRQHGTRFRNRRRVRTRVYYWPVCCRTHTVVLHHHTTAALPGTSHSSANRWGSTASRTTQPAEPTSLSSIENLADSAPSSQKQNKTKHTHLSIPVQQHIHTYVCSDECRQCVKGRGSVGCDDTEGFTTVCFVRALP